MAEVQQNRTASPLWRRAKRLPLMRLWLRIGHFIRLHLLSSLTRRIAVLNLAALVVLVSGILYLNQFRDGLNDARVESLLVQGEIIAAAIASSATVETDTLTVDPERLLQLQAGESVSPFDEFLDDFPINPEKVAPILRRLISPTRTRARIYDRNGDLTLDSRNLYSRGQIFSFNLPSPATRQLPWYQSAWSSFIAWFNRNDLPPYKELGAANGRGYPEVVTALNGSPASVIRSTEDGVQIVSVAVPISRFRAVHGVLLLSKRGGDIDAIIQAERLAIVRVFAVAAVVTSVLSILLASTIAGPIRRLAAAADRVRQSIRAREEIPDFSERSDEIAALSGSLRDMTRALYDRIAAIESFAADVAHELKNPLTSLRSAVETLPLARNDESRERLLGIIQHDVRRLDRLISDISDASRLDAELVRRDTETVDVAELVDAMVSLQQETAARHNVTIAHHIEQDGASLKVLGHGSRLAQVLTNLMDNALSFSPDGGTITLTVRRYGHFVEVIVDDNGPGIQADQVDRIFTRFYTDRPEGESFGNHSGLGLSISRQIVEAHKGTLSAENRYAPDADETARPEGARFIVCLPAK
ncbi:sensor histidine kinase [Coralliovum pocilloporae]|uniref:sensor histidine kinase n=1 Tax=Coralliovum pocilloporae TaxID=3066369 RepID=UPI0033075C18